MKSKFTKIKCKLCGGVIQSEYDGNFIECKCGKTFVDEVRNGYIRTTEYGEILYKCISEDCNNLINKKDDFCDCCYDKLGDE